MKNDKSKSLLTGVAMTSIGFLVASLWMILSSWHDFKGTLLIDPSSLATTDGGIISSSMITGKNRKNKTYYQYSIKYVYVVAGNTYYSDEVTFDGDDSFIPEFAQRFVQKYPVGKKVTVYYDPRSPDFSVLEPEDTDSSVFKLLLLIVSSSSLILSGAYWFLRKRYRR